MSKQNETLNLPKIKDLAVDFHKKKVLNIKDTPLSSGKMAPYYMDMRVILSYPELMSSIIQLLKYRIMECIPEFDKLASVPVGAVPFASQLSAIMGKASVLVRDKPKEHGTKKMIEGKLDIDDRVILIEDVITSGASVIKTIKKLKNRGAEVVAVWTLLNREEGGLENIKYEYDEIPVYSLFTVGDIFNQLVKEKLVNPYDWEKIKYYQETQYKGMIRELRGRNEIKQKPDWEKNRAMYFASRYPYWLSMLLSGEEEPNLNPSNLLLSLCDTRLLTPSQIVSQLIKNKSHNVPMIITDFDKIKSSELEILHNTTGCKVIYDEAVVLGWNSNKHIELDKCYPNVDYKYDTIINHILVSGVVDIQSAINNLGVHNISYSENKQSKKLLVISFNSLNVSDLVNDDVIWQNFDKLVDAVVGNNLDFAGLVFNYSDMKHITKYRDLWKRVPVMLWIDDWHLHPSMLSESIAVDYHQSWLDMKYVMERLRPWQIIMDTDAVCSNYPFMERLGHYSDFFKSTQLTELITDICKNILDKKIATDDELLAMDADKKVLELNIRNVQYSYKNACHKIKMNRMIDSKETKLDAKGNKLSIPRAKLSSSVNNLCQGLVSYCQNKLKSSFSFAYNSVFGNNSNTDNNGKQKQL